MPLRDDCESAELRRLLAECKNSSSVLMKPGFDGLMNGSFSRLFCSQGSSIRSCFLGDFLSRLDLRLGLRLCNCCEGVKPTLVSHLRGEGLRCTSGYTILEQSKGHPSYFASLEIFSLILSSSTFARCWNSMGLVFLGSVGLKFFGTTRYLSCK